MKLSFSTNGWKFTFDEIIEIAKENKFQGIELHDVFAKNFEEGKPFYKENVVNTRKKLFEQDLVISCIDSTLDFCVAEEVEIFENTLSLMELANGLACDFIRIRAIGNGEDFEEQNAKVKRTLSRLLPYL